MGMSHLFKCDTEGTRLFAIVKMGTKFGFGGAGEDFAHDVVAQYVEGTVGFESGVGLGRCVGQIKITGSTGACFDDG